MPSSQITKKAIAQALKELMGRRSFDKITVADITAGCGLNRQTFYYHFNDKYSLLNWIFDREVMGILKSGITLDNWQRCVLDMLEEMYKSERFYWNALRVSPQSEFEIHLLSLAKEMFFVIIGQLAGEGQITEGDMRFMADFYAYGSVGIIVEWAKNGMREPPEQLMAMLSHLVNDSHSVTLKRAMAAKNHDNQENMS
ncbi:MAG: TetR/AcrR family transcriptional regulator C-terminal domain-containing protein [Oscillospiraceae bacterium]|nr:TetR/AcrR family transcriptional regulator C-terminal domain-containing protein [Oscillospiraceae bacterium]